LNKDKHIDARYIGEDNQTLVIRTKISKDGSTSPLDQECVRYITPPQVSPHFAEVSGVFDPFWFPANKEDRNNLYKFLSTNAETYYDENDISKKIPFPFDPGISGIQILEGTNLKYSGKFRSQESNILETTKPIKMVLGEKSKSSTPSEINFSLQKGEYKNFLIKSESVNGVSSSLKPFQLVHAVQRPYCVYLEKYDVKQILQTGTPSHHISLKEIFAFEKFRQEKTNYLDEHQYSVKIFSKNKSRYLLPFATTGEIILTGCYNDYILNPANEKGWSYISKKSPIVEYGKPQNGINDSSIENISCADNFYLEATWSNLDESTKNDTLDTILSDSFTIEDIIINKGLNGFKHTFPDTKFREVSYTLELVSKFQHFFDVTKHNLKGEKPFSLFFNLGKQIIQNSAKSSKPNITTIIPIFTINPPSKNENTYTFEHYTFRIYLGDHWFETGLNEKIAVIHEKSNNDLEFEKKSGLPQVETDTVMVDGVKKPVTDSVYLNKKISIFADDPTVEYDSTLSKNDGSYLDTTKLYKSYKNGSKLEELKINTTFFTNTASNPGDTTIKKRHAFSVFEVEWDLKKKEFFCDLVLNKKRFNVYPYLIKFAVCRFQENSIHSEELGYDYRFSDVAMTDLVSSLPKRVINFEDSYITIQKDFRQGNRFGAEEKAKPNIFYLVIEKAFINEEVTETDDINKPEINKLNFEGDRLYYLQDKKDKIYLTNALRRNKDFKKIFIEEYECIDIDGDFNMDEQFNPRNDPSKRLKFFYNIKEK